MSETTPQNPTEGATSSTETAVASITVETKAVDTQQSAESKGTLLSEETKAEGDKGTAEAKTETTETKTEGAPEKYDFKAPEGKDFDANVLDAFAAGAKEANLTQEAAQKLLDKVAPVMQARQAEQVEAIRKEWLDSSTADKEFGGEKIKENLSQAKKALDSFASPALRTLLEDTGLGNHPEVIRFMYRAGKAISQDTFVGGKATSTTDSARSFYPNSNMQ
jgi:hypothetical protein